MFILKLNDMRAPKVEIITPVVRAETKKALLDFMDGEHVESYQDENWMKSFKKDGPLEWYNLMSDAEEQIVDIETLEKRIEYLTQDWNNVILTMPEVGV